MEKPFLHLPHQSNASANAEVEASAINEAHCTGASSKCVQLSDTVYPSSLPRTVIRGESPKQDNDRSKAALTDWLNISFPFHPESNNPLAFFKSFSEATKGILGGMTDQERGLHGWNHSFRFDRGCVMFAYGGQRNTAFLSLPGEGCSFISDWLSFTSFLRDDLKGHITRWDGAVDDFSGVHTIERAVALYIDGGFKQGGRNPNPKQHGNWITPDDLGRTFEVGSRRNGKLIRIYEKGKQLGYPSVSWVRWEVELHAKDRSIPWEVLLYPGDYVAGAYPCMSWVSQQASRIRTIKAQDSISYERLKQVASTAYGQLINTMMQREGSAERVVELLRRHGVPRRLAFTNDYLNTLGNSDES